MKKLNVIFLCLVLLTSSFFCASPISAATTKIVTVGDSITWGSCSGDSIGSKVEEQTYQGYLRTFAGSSYQIINYGVSGLSVLPDPYYMTRPSDRNKALGAAYNNQVKEALASSPDIVLIMLGTNDAKITSDGKPGVWDSLTGGEENFYQAYKSLVLQFVNLPCKPEVYIMLPPPALNQGDFGRNSYRITQSVLRDSIIPIQENIAEELGLDVIDIYHTFPDPGTSNGRLRLSGFLMDCVHPNARGYNLIARTVAQSLGFSTTPAPPTSQNNQNQNQNQNTGSTSQNTTPLQSAPNTGEQATQTPAQSTQPTYLVQYHSNNGENLVFIDPVHYAQGEQATTRSEGDFAYKGHSFLGWSEKADATKPDLLVNSTFTVTSNLSLYAVWEKTFSITFHSFPEDALQEVPSPLQNIPKGRKIPLPNSDSLNYDKTLWTFLGWSISPDGELLSEGSLQLTDADADVYARFEKKKQAPTPEPQSPTDDAPEEPAPPAPGEAEQTPAKNPVSPSLLPVSILAAGLLVFFISLIVFAAKRRKGNPPPTTEE